MEYFKEASLIVSIALLLASIFSYTAFVACILAILSRYEQVSFEKRKARLLAAYQKVLTPLLFDANEGDEEELKRIKKEFLKNDEAKEIMVEFLMNQQRNFSGEINDRLFYVYDKLELAKYSFKKINSKKWHLMAIGIREVGLLGKEGHYKSMEDLINYDNIEVRNEAQIALVRLRGINGLEFLKDLKYRLSEWQQLNLFEVLSFIEWDEKPKLGAYLDNNNPTVVSFVLKLVGFFKIMESPQRLLSFLNHADRDVRKNAIQAIVRLEYYHQADDLIEVYSQQPLEVKVEILKALYELGTSNHAKFLMNEFQSTQFEISLHAAKALHEINPELLMQYKLMEKDDEYQHLEIKMQLIS